MRKDLILISIIITILYMIWMVLSYLGYVRYMKIKYCNEKQIEKYINNYKYIPNNKDNKVSIVLTINSDDLRDINKIYSVLLSLLDQTIRADEFRLNIVEYKEKYEIPNLVKEIATVYKVPNNCDIITYPLYRVMDSDTLIIYVKPNIIYGKDYIETIIEKSKENKNNIIKNNNEVCILTKNNYVIVNNKICINEECEIKDINYNENFKI